MRQQQRHAAEAAVKPQALGKARNVRRPRSESLRQIDAFVGSRVRLRRTIKGLSQTDLGGAVGVTFQQMQKYESGANRIGASRLFQLGEVLDVPVSFFFDGVKGDAPAEQPGTAEVRELATRETLALARAFDRIRSLRSRRSLLELARSMGAECEEG